MRRFLLLCIPMLVLAGCSGDSDSGSGEFVRVWGTGEADLVDGNHLNARFHNPANVEVGPNGSVFVADYDNDAVRKIGSDGEVTTLVRQEGFAQPFGMTMGADGMLYVQTDFNDQGQKDATTGTVWRVHPTVGGATVVARNLGRPRGLLGLPDGRIVMSDIVRHTLRFLNPDNGAVTFLAGRNEEAGFENGVGSNALFNRPYGMTLIGDGSILVADQGNNRIRRVTVGGVVSTFAGSGAVGMQNGPQTTATFNGPQDVTALTSPVPETIYVADTFNHVIRKISSGSVTTQAGNGIAGFVDAEGTSASFFGLEGISLTHDGSVLWIADGTGGEDVPFNRVRRLRVP
jgi:hypothetical protein